MTFDIKFVPAVAFTRSVNPKCETRRRQTKLVRVNGAIVERPSGWSPEAIHMKKYIRVMKERKWCRACWGRCGRDQFGWVRITGIRTEAFAKMPRNAPQREGTDMALDDFKLLGCFRGMGSESKNTVFVFEYVALGLMNPYPLQDI